MEYAWFNNVETKPGSPDIFECSHILIAARRNDAEAFGAARRRAEVLLAKLRDETGAFKALATDHSECPSRANGGNLGQISPGMTTPEFERALSGLKPGEISSLVETRYGFHIIRLERRVDGALLPFELVSARIAAYLAERSRRLAIASTSRVLRPMRSRSGWNCPRPAISGCIEAPCSMRPGISKQMRSDAADGW